MSRTFNEEELAVSQQMLAAGADEAEMKPLMDMLESDPMLLAALDELARKEHQLLALKAQASIEAVNREYQSFNAVEGLGGVKRMMPAFAWHDIAFQMGGTECFDDKSFNRYLDRKAPETRVKAVGAKPGNGMALIVGWTPPPKRYVRKFD